MIGGRQLDGPARHTGTQMLLRSRWRPDTASVAAHPSMHGRPIVTHGQSSSGVGDAASAYLGNCPHDRRMHRQCACSGLAVPHQLGTARMGKFLAGKVLVVKRDANNLNYHTA